MTFAMVVMMICGTIISQTSHHGHHFLHDRQADRQTGQTYLTFELESPGNLCRAAFAILAMFFCLSKGQNVCQDGLWQKVPQSALCQREGGKGWGIKIISAMPKWTIKDAH